MCASTLWPLSSSTRNMALGSDSRIVPSSTMASSLGLGRTNSSPMVGLGAPHRATGGRARTNRTTGLRTDRRTMVAGRGPRTTWNATPAAGIQLRGSADVRWRMAGGRPETMTVVFTDLVASTVWRSRVGADVADVQTAELERSSRRVVEAAGGTV